VQENILSEDENTINKLMNLAVNLSKELKDKLNADGIKIVMNNGEAAGQEVFHTHVHLIPYYNQESNLSVDEVFDILKK
jgi:histidine triad (HIT) family protein